MKESGVSIGISFFQCQFIIISKLIQNMNQSRVRSPDPTIKKNNNASSPNLSKSRTYLPSRYAQEIRPQKSGFHDILNSIESKTKQDPIEAAKELSSKIKMKTSTNAQTQESKKEKNFQFKAKPLKRQESDKQNFNQIFLNPRQDALKQLQKNAKIQENKKTISKEYEKLLKFESGDTNMEEVKKQLTETIKAPNYAEHIQMLESADLFGLHISSEEIDFCDNPISIDPPDFPGTNSSAGPNSSNYAPSIPSNLKGMKESNIKELLMRARAGMNTDDIQKQAHLSYFLGEVYSEKKYHKESLKFFRRFLGFAKAMEDKIGMSLGANRVANAYYKCGDIEKSIIFHNQNLKLSDNQNCFVGFYNIGICYRKQKKLQEALEYLESAYNWAHEKAEEESQCISLAQIAVTFQEMELYQQAIQKFEASLKLCENLKREELKLHNLRYILRISSQFSLKPVETLQIIAEEAFQSAKLCSTVKNQDVLRCNIGILKGIEEFFNLQQTQTEINQIEQDIQ